MGSPSSSQPKARVTYKANWTDAIGRVVATADYGTNGGTALSRPATIPAASDSVLVTLTTFDSVGNLLTTTDPKGMVVYFTYDAVGREVQRILNYQALSSSSSSSSRSSASGSSSSGSGGLCTASTDTNVTIQTAYNADGNTASITALNAATGNQVTQYLYGTTLSTSSIASNLLKVADVYPDSVGGSDQVLFTYNRQGERTTLTDQNGTVHSYNYDLLGRWTEDRITTLGSGVNGAVLRLERAYEVRGMVQTVTSYDNATVGSGNVVNQVQLTYNTFAQLAVDYQSTAGAVNTLTTPACLYSYVNGTGNTTRLTALTYPNGRNLNYNYGVSGGINDASSRVGSLLDNDGVTHLADYFYLGQASIIQTSAAQPGLTYTLLGLGGGNDPVTGDIYQGLDLFGRTKDLIWSNSGSSSSSSSSSSSGAANILERIQHTYDRAGDRLTRGELADTARLHDELYGYDGLDRLATLNRGKLNSTNTALTTKAFGQCWTLDATGNWSGFRQDNTGSGTWNLIQSRVSNPVNAISNLSNSVGGSWTVPAYDAAGNMKSMPQPGSLGQSYTATYDAWGRLVGLSFAGSTVAGYQYDGLQRRVVKQRYTGGVLSETRQLFYSADWQAVEERTATTAQRQFVWGLRYRDDLVLRDRDTTGGGTLNERLYALEDPNGNVTAVVSSAGVVQERYGYDGYGMPTVLTASFGTLASSAYDWETRYGGYRWDSESGLYQVRLRGYHPSLGGWIQRDPIGLAGGGTCINTSDAARFPLRIRLDCLKVAPERSWMP